MRPATLRHHEHTPVHTHTHKGTTDTRQIADEHNKDMPHHGRRHTISCCYFINAYVGCPRGEAVHQNIQDMHVHVNLRMPCRSQQVYRIESSFALYHKVTRDEARPHLVLHRQASSDNVVRVHMANLAAALAPSCAFVLPPMCKRLSAFLLNKTTFASPLGTVMTNPLSNKSWGGSQTLCNFASSRHTL